MPRLSDQRFHWVHGRMTVLGPDEMRELVIDAWRMVVPKNGWPAVPGHRDTVEARRTILGQVR